MNQVPEEVYSYFEKKDLKLEDFVQVQLNFNTSLFVYLVHPIDSTKAVVSMNLGLHDSYQAFISPVGFSFLETDVDKFKDLCELTIGKFSSEEDPLKIGEFFKSKTKKILFTWIKDTDKTFLKVQELPTSQEIFLKEKYAYKPGVILPLRVIPLIQEAIAKILGGSVNEKD